jgi:transposase
MLVQQTLGHDPFLCGTVYALRGRRAGLIKLMWHDGVGMCLFIKRLERGQFIWPMSASGTVTLTPGQLSTLLEGCEWMVTVRNLRPELPGDLQAIGDEGDNDVRLDALIRLMIDRTDRQIVLELLEGLLDLDQLQIQGPELRRILPGQV